MTCYLFTLDFIAENTTYPPRHGYVQLFFAQYDERSLAHDKIYNHVLITT